MLIFRAWATRDLHGKQPMIIKVVDNRTSVGQKPKYEHHAINAQTHDIHLPYTTLIMTSATMACIPQDADDEVQFKLVIEMKKVLKCIHVTSE